MLRVLLLVLFSMIASAQQEGWKKPFPAHKIAGNLFYVGTEDLACFLITTPEGHILINSGLADSTPLIRRGMEKLGYKLDDIKILLTMQAHFDHVAALSEIQKLTGAKMYATAQTRRLEDGGRAIRSSNPSSRPSKWIAEKLKDGDSIRLGGTELLVHLTPGHTKGASVIRCRSLKAARNTRYRSRTWVPS